MILLDTSVWVDLLSRRPQAHLTVEQRASVVTCPLIVQEVLQGVRDDGLHRRIEAGLLALPRIGDPAAMDLNLMAAALYRQARRRGLTVRSTVDCLIAAIALRHRVAVWHRDRDFDAIATFTELRTLRGDSLEPEAR